MNQKEREVVEIIKNNVASAPSFPVVPKEDMQFLIDQLEASEVDARKYRALQAQQPSDGSRGQLDAWAQLQVDIQTLQDMHEAAEQQILKERERAESAEAEVEQLQMDIDEEMGA